MATNGALAGLATVRSLSQQQIMSLSDVLCLRSFFFLPPERQRHAKQIRRGLFLIPRIWICLQVSSDAVHKLKPSRPEAAADSQNHDLRPLSHQLVRQRRGQGARVPQTSAETCGQVCPTTRVCLIFFIVTIMRK